MESLGSLIEPKEREKEEDPEKRKEQEKAKSRKKEDKILNSQVINALNHNKADDMFRDIIQKTDN